MATQSWQAFKRPHNYNDGTTHTWCVGYTTEDGTNIQIADWLDGRSAHIIAAALDMAEAIEQALDDMADSHCVCEATKQLLKDALARAHG